MIGGVRRLSIWLVVGFVIKKINSKQLGNITEVEVMLEFLKQGYQVLTPYGDCERYDFVVEIQNKFYKIQVKTAHIEEGKISFNTASTHYSNGKCIHDTYTKKDIDYFAFYIKEWDVCCLVPIEDIGTQKQICLRKDDPLSPQRKIHYVDDYSFDKILCVETLHDDSK